MTVKPPAPPPLPDELDRLLRRLRLPYVRKAAPEVIANATAQRWEHAEVLRVVLAEEAAGRDQATIRTRRRASGLPAGKTFDAWEPDRSAIPPQTQRALQTLEWIDRADVLCVCGPSTTPGPKTTTTWRSSASTNWSSWLHPPQIQPRPTIGSRRWVRPGDPATSVSE
jgi:IstB-like ATP binding protein